MPRVGTNVEYLESGRVRVSPSRNDPFRPNELLSSYRKAQQMVSSSFGNRLRRAGNILEMRSANGKDSR